MDLEQALESQGMSALVYGESGMGKTHLIGTLKGKTLIIASEVNGLRTLKRTGAFSSGNFEVEVLPKNEKGIKELFERLLIEESDYDNIVVDSWSELDRQSLMLKAKNNGEDGVPTLQNYGQNQVKQQRLLQMFIDTAILHGKRVIATCLSKEFVEANSEDGEIVKAYPCMTTKGLQPFICQMFDIVAHIERGAKGDRFLRLTGDGNCIAKDRIANRKFCVADAEVLFSEKTGTEKGE